MNNADFVDFVNSHGGLQTGSFSIGGWLMETVFGRPPLEGSHTLINLDSEVSVSGRMPYNAGQIGSPSRHKAALKVATNETIELLNHIDTL